MNDDLPPMDSSFSSSSARPTNTRMGTFMPNQFTRLQAFWSEILLSKNIGCTMAFDSGHSHCRVTYRLTNPRSEDKEITVSAIEYREHNGSYKYTLECHLDGKLHHQEDLMKNIKARNEIPEFVIQNLRQRIVHMNQRDFSVPLPLEINPEVVSLSNWKNRPK